MADQEITNTETGDLADASKEPLVSAPQQTPSVANDGGIQSPPLPMRDTDPRTSDSEVARILKDIKLPERSEYRATADVRLPPEPPPVPEEIPQTPTIATPRSLVSAVHTLKDDFQAAVQDQKISLVQAAALQEEKRSRQTAAPTEARVAQNKNTFKTIVILAALLVLGIAMLGAGYLILRERAGVTPSTFLVEGLLFSEQTISIPIQNMEGAELKRQLAFARSSEGLTLGAITRIAPVIEEAESQGEPSFREATTREFLTAIEAQIPEELLRALGSEFFFGFHSVDENAPVFIIPVTSYERAFAGMLTWEKTINADLAPIFTNVPSLVRQTDGLLTERTFSDTVMRNFDIRVLKDDTGTVQLYYSFPTRTILIIAESPYSFAEILARLRADRRL